MGEHYSYQIGDLVKCIYDLFDYYDYFWDQEPASGYPFFGIIIEIQKEFLYEEKYGYDKVYVVQCFDGYMRFFAHWEMRLVSTSS